MADRYFVDEPIAGDTARLTGPEAHHLAHVMRAKAGHAVTLFDGSGAEFAGTVIKVGRAEIELAIAARSEVDREASLHVTLGVALPKGDRQRWLVEKATELGVRRIVPLVTERGNERPSPAALGKLRRAVIEASKQCGRNRLLELAEPCRLAEYLADTSAALRLLAHPGGAALPEVLAGRQAEHAVQTEVALAVGPEGGFSGPEFQAATSAGWTPVGLGRRILRIETAALALAAALLGD